jgi:hypothetical protein
VLYRLPILDRAIAIGPSKYAATGEAEQRRQV